MWEMPITSNRESVECADSSRTGARAAFAIREWRRNGRLRRHLLGLALAIAVFSYLGPFGTGTRLNPVELAIYWAIAMTVNWAIAMAIVPFSTAALKRAGKPAWFGVTVGALVAATPGTAVVVALEAAFNRPLTLAAELAYVYSCVAVVFVVVGFLAYRLIERAEFATDDGLPRQPAAPRPGAPFLSRLSARRGRNLLHLHMQDHYVEAHTDKGSELVLLRFRDAIRELEGLDGMQVHRSHWVAASAVDRAVRRDGRLFLKLTNGDEVPVSRSFAPALKERGWI